MVARVLTAIALVAVAVYCLVSPSILPLLVLALAVGGLALRELVRMESWGWREAGFGALGLAASAASVIFPLPYAWAGPLLLFVLGSAAALVAPESLGRFKPARGFASAWVAAPLASLVAAHGWSAYPGSAELSLVFLAIWSADTGALLFGRKWGRTPILPEVSPKKTWEGWLGGTALSVVLTPFFAAAFEFSILGAVLLAVTASVLGLAGDLIESQLKRRSGRKDAGGLLPGHGGVLDRVDSLLAAAIPCLMLMQAVDPALFHVKQLLP
ncbi:MAG: phosphatidate cytidylyltransferase [Fimbriimonadaceae bacterium]|nr:phosphatidate cytidylyltransferase [Fimbriimonadaceae bacterium]